MAADLSELSFADLRAEAKRLGIEKTGRITKAALLELVEQAKAESEKKYSRLRDSITEASEMTGVVQILPDGFGFMHNDSMSSPDEYVYVSASQVQKFKLLSGDTISGKVRSPKEGEKYYAMLFIEAVNGEKTESIIRREREAMSIANEKDMSMYEKSHRGILEITPDGYGFLRTENYMCGEADIYVSASQIRKYRLRTGDEVQGRIRLSGENDRYDALLYVERVNNRAPETVVNRPYFEKLVPVFPSERLRLETEQNILSTRILDIFAPIGKGQRGLIVSAPKAGKTIMLKQIAASIERNHPEVKLIILLIDERPEEVTDIRRSTGADVVYSTFDQKPANHIKAAEAVLERAKRLVELGDDVVILMDSITRFARANNLVVPSSGRTLSGGLDPESFYFPKKFFGAARNIENGGSLTIVATALVDTGSRMDDLIYEEFKGTGNMEVHLSRAIAELRVFPAIDIQKSGTRREELLLDEATLSAQYAIRKALTKNGASSFADVVVQMMGKTKSNRQFLDWAQKSYSGRERGSI